MISRLGMCWNTITENAKSNSNRRPIPKRPHQCGATAERSLPLFSPPRAAPPAPPPPPPLPHHFAADIHRPDFTEITGESPRHPARATADFEHPHVPGIPSLTNVVEVVENLLLHGDLPGLEEFLVRPLVLPGHHVMAGIFPRPAIPIAAHLDELPGDLRTGHLLYCNSLAKVGD